jgi:intein/homing endonuclease
MAYVLGYFAADGCMIENKHNGNYYIEFKSTDLILLEHVNRATGSDYKIALYEKGGNCKPCYRVQITSPFWYEDLTKLGFTQNKSRLMKFPKVPKNYLGAFTRGYFDGDGCVYFKELKFADRKNKRWVLMTLFTSGSREFLESLR